MEGGWACGEAETQRLTSRQGESLTIGCSSLCSFDGDDAFDVVYVDCELEGEWPSKVYIDDHGVVSTHFHKEFVNSPCQHPICFAGTLTKSETMDEPRRAKTQSPKCCSSPPTDLTGLPPNTPSTSLQNLGEPHVSAELTAFLVLSPPASPVRTRRMSLMS